jgi:hypothetical protein
MNAPVFDPFRPLKDATVQEIQFELMRRAFKDGYTPTGSSLFLMSIAICGRPCFWID